MKLKKKTLIYLWAKFGPISQQTDSDVTVRGSATMDRLAAAVSQCVTREDIKPQITPVVCASSIKPQAAGCWSVKALQMLLKLEKRGINNSTFTSSMYRKGSPRFYTRHHRSRITINIWVVSTQPLLHVRSKKASECLHWDTLIIDNRNEGKSEHQKGSPHQPKLQLKS